MYNIIDYGAIGDGKTLSTVAIQAAVDACSANGGGTVFIPADGVFVSGSVHLHDNVHIVFENGAVLLGSTDMNDFDPYEEITYPKYQDRSHSYFHHSLFYAENCNNISFGGVGKIDMQSAWEVDDSRRGAKPIALKECKDVLIADLIIRNATDLAVYFAGCENVRVTGLNIRAHIDGISPDSCKNVVISDCILNVGDDAIVPKSSFTLNRFQYCENLTITNCVISSRCNAIKLGTESNAGFINVAISNCSIYNTRYSGIALEAVDGALFDGITVSNISMRNVGNPFLIIVLNRARGPEGTTIGKIRNVTFSNITANGPYKEWVCMPHYYDAFIQNSIVQTPMPIPAIIAGQPDSIIENVSLSNIQITMPGGGTVEDRSIVIPEIRDGYPEGIRFGLKHPIYGMFARDVDNLKLFNVEFFTDSPDEREPILLDRVVNYKAFN